MRHIFVPAERKIPKIRIETRQADKLQRHRIIVAVDSWPRWSRYPQVRLITQRYNDRGDATRFYIFSYFVLLFSPIVRIKISSEHLP